MICKLNVIDQIMDIQIRIIPNGFKILWFSFVFLFRISVRLVGNQFLQKWIAHIELTPVDFICWSDLAEMIYERFPFTLLSVWMEIPVCTLNYGKIKSSAAFWTAIWYGRYRIYSYISHQCFMGIVVSPQLEALRFPIPALIE